MRFEVLDVGHGFCAYVETDDGNLVVFDCGHSAEPEFRPSEYLFFRGHRSVSRLFITNYDEDHISDLPKMQEKMKAKILHRNRSVTADQLESLKKETGPISPAMGSLLEMIREYSGDVSDPPELPRLAWKSFLHAYGGEFADTNNLSLVTFLDVGGLNVLIPGDLETPGWVEHLRNTEFRAQLEKVDVFIASHHGRESGYCEGVFQYCNPDLVVISDGPLQYASQEMVDTYARHATGTTFKGETRYVITTRKDGPVHWVI